jgi:hypothetical protein
VICRDRPGSHADGARTGAPDAVQVADRFHLWQNLAKAVEKCVAAHRACLAGPSPPPAPQEQGPALPEPEDAGQPDPAGKYAERTRRTTRWPTSCAPRDAGSARSPATWQELADGRWQGPRPSKLDPYKPNPGQHADGGHGSIRRLFREIQAIGYDGSYPIVRNYLARQGPARNRCRRHRPPSATSRTGARAARTP